jgi:hypothetical protein
MMRFVVDKDVNLRAEGRLETECQHPLQPEHTSSYSSEMQRIPELRFSATLPYSRRTRTFSASHRVPREETSWPDPPQPHGHVRSFGKGPWVIVTFSGVGRWSILFV